jgi:hypothetical protein
MGMFDGENSGYHWIVPIFDGDRYSNILKIRYDIFDDHSFCTWFNRDLIYSSYHPILEPPLKWNDKGFGVLLWYVT